MREGRRGRKDTAGLGMRGPGAALAVPLVRVAVIELATRCRLVPHEGPRRGLETDIAGGEPHELVGGVLVVGGPKLVELDSWPFRWVGAVAEDSIRLLDEHYQRGDADNAVEDLEAAPEGALVQDLGLDTIEVSPKLLKAGGEEEGAVPGR